MTIDTAPEIPRALLVSIRTPGVTEAESGSSLRELERLVTTLGFRVVGTETQARPSTFGATAVGAGKLEELRRLVQGEAVGLGNGFGAAGNAGPGSPNLVIFDCELRPSQFRHLENALGCEVLDRTGVIIEIFSRHARTPAARLQVEIARLTYLSPRLREVGSSGERQSGRGAGESALALGRRAVRDRLAELRRELEVVQRERAVRRAARADRPLVALVGYTNAGKSSLMRALTGSDVLVENKLFATLDTTVRTLQPAGVPRVLVSDTVGFIKKLPHELVASFRSTLDEALEASLLLYVVDAADPAFRTQLEVVGEVLREVGVWGTPRLLVLNKADLLGEAARAGLAKEFPEGVFVCSRDPASVAMLRERILAHFEAGMLEEDVFLPYEKSSLLGELRASLRVLNERHEESGTRFRVRGPAGELARFRSLIGEP